MTAKLDKALKRLKGILPLRERQNECGKEIRELHQQVLRSFVTRGRILTREEMAQQVSNLEHAVDVLRSCDMVIFSEHGDPVGAYPFTMEAREHRVRVNGHQVHAMCALDALAVGPMFGMKTQVDSRCRITGDPVNIQQSGKAIENADEVGDLHLGIAWGAADADSRCADSLCRQMVFLRDSAVARQWLMDDSASREIFTLPEAVEFAARIFVPLMS
ncbi:MAG TPA: alkylmercury lyase family protein [Burkholderiales bacterium]|nr:alkylmercury lyase family protein [Burkholderiales bacterium]